MKTYQKRLLQALLPVALLLVAASVSVRIMQGQLQHEQWMDRHQPIPHITLYIHGHAK